MAYVKFEETSACIVYSGCRWKHGFILVKSKTELKLKKCHKVEIVTIMTWRVDKLTDVKKTYNSIY